MPAIYISAFLNIAIFAEIFLLCGAIPGKPEQQEPSILQRELEKTEDLTVLMSAVVEGDIKRIEGLIESGADVNERNSRGTTALLLAAYGGHSGLARVVIGLGGKDLYGQILQESRKEGVATYEEIVRILLSAGADANVSEPAVGLTPLTGAIGLGSLSMAEALLKAGLDINAGNEVKLSPLIVATNIPEDRAEMLRLLIRNGAHVDAKDVTGGTALFYATEQGKLAEVKILLNAGADVNVQNMMGKTPLIAATSRDQEDVDLVRTLLRSGADVDLHDSFGGTALLWASARYTEIVQLLIQAGADVNVQTKDGHTPLQIATSNNQLEIIRILKNAGAR